MTYTIQPPYTPFLPFNFHIHHSTSKYNITHTIQPPYFIPFLYNFYHSTSVYTIWPPSTPWLTQFDLHNLCHIYHSTCIYNILRVDLHIHRGWKVHMEVEQFVVALWILSYRTKWVLADSYERLLSMEIIIDAAPRRNRGTQTQSLPQVRVPNNIKSNGRAIIRETISAYGKISSCGEISSVWTTLCVRQNYA